MKRLYRRSWLTILWRRRNNCTMWLRNRQQKTAKVKGRLLAKSSYGWRRCNGGKGTVAGLNVKVGELVNRSLANCKGG